MIDHHRYKARQREILQTIAEPNAKGWTGREAALTTAAHALDELMLEVIGADESIRSYNDPKRIAQSRINGNRNKLRQSLRSIVKGSAKDE